MSNVTRVLLTTSLADVDKIDLINEIVPFRGTIGLVSCVDPMLPVRPYGGDAEMGMSVAMGVCGELPLDKLLAAIRQLKWEHPDSVQLFIMSEYDDDEVFREIDWRQDPTDGLAQ